MLVYTISLALEAQFVPYQYVCLFLHSPYFIQTSFLHSMNPEIFVTYRKHSRVLWPNTKQKLPFPKSLDISLVNKPNTLATLMLLGHTFVDYGKFYWRMPDIICPLWIITQSSFSKNHCHRNMLEAKYLVVRYLL